MKKQYWIALILIGLFTVSIIPITADDGSGCSTPDSWGLSTNCFVQKIYNQNIQLTQEQNQTNHLLAYNFCKGTPTEFTLDHVPTQQELIQIKNSGMFKDNPFQDCVNNILGKTK